MIGVLLMAHGTPIRMEDLPSFLESIRSRPPTQAEVDDLRNRYTAIGGLSPLLELTEEHYRNLVQVLERDYPDGFRVALGMKHAAPLIEDGLDVLEDSLKGEDVDRIIGLVLAPHFSKASIGGYESRVQAALQSKQLAQAADQVYDTPFQQVPFRMVRSWHLSPGLIDMWASRIMGEIASLSGSDISSKYLSTKDLPSTGDRLRTHIVFTAHSLPARLAEAGDPYAQQVAETAAAVAAKAQLQDWSVAWQSVPPGSTVPWLEPDVSDVIRKVAADGCDAVVVCPVGFVSDHLETLYDLDVVALKVAYSCGLLYRRCASLDHDIRVAETLADVINQELSSI
jgi:ferrochelatase